MINNRNSIKKYHHYENMNNFSNVYVQHTAINTLKCQTSYLDTKP